MERETYITMRLRRSDFDAILKAMHIAIQFHNFNADVEAAVSDDRKFRDAYEALLEILRNWEFYDPCF